jgi:hypothetical protein
MNENLLLEMLMRKNVKFPLCLFQEFAWNAQIPNKYNSNSKARKKKLPEIKGINFPVRTFKVNIVNGNFIFHFGKCSIYPFPPTFSIFSENEPQSGEKYVLAPQPDQMKCEFEARPSNNVCPISSTKRTAGMQRYREKGFAAPLQTHVPSALCASD